MCLCATIQQVGNQFISDLSDYFDVELINRFSQKYTFSEISKSVYRKIVEKRLASEIKVIKRLHPELNMDSLFSADEQAPFTLLTHGKNIQTKPKLTLRHTKKSMTAPFTGAVNFFYSDNFTLIKQI